MKLKVALFADIHSNLEAISACLGHARAPGAQRYAFLGDLVGYGADPVAVLDLIEQYATDGAVVVLGNHVAAALGRGVDSLNSGAQFTINRTQAQLGEKQRNFLANLPLAVSEENVLFVHASALAPEQWTYVTGPKEAKESIGAAKPITFSAGTCMNRSFATPLPPEEIIRLGSALALALDDLHRQDVVHLDLKPTNALYREGDEVVPIDFGLAHHAHYPDLLAEEFRFPVGYWADVSPEQTGGRAATSTRSAGSCTNSPRGDCHSENQIR